MKGVSRSAVAAAAASLVGTILIAPAVGVADTLPAETCVPAAIPFDPEDIHLTGRWQDDDDATYYVRQVGDKVWLIGMSDDGAEGGETGQAVTSAGYGTLAGTTVTLEVADVPRGNVYNAGTIEVTVSGDADGNLEARTTAPDATTTVFTPCQPEPIMVLESIRPFSYTVPFGLASWHAPATSDLKVMYTPDVPESGISFWVLGPGWEPSCSAPPDLAAPADWTPAAIEAYLRTIPELEVGEASAATLAGRPATVVDVTTSAAATGCDGEGYVRLFRESGQEAGLDLGRSARLLMVDAGDAAFVIELWGPDPETWWPIAQRIAESVQLHLDTEADATEG